MLKQAIIWRIDLQNVPVGKKMGQAGHAAHQFMKNKRVGNIITLDEEEVAWLEDEYKKIVLVARSEKELLILHEKALELGLRSHLVVDNGHTVFSEPTTTCLAIGPNLSEMVDLVTGEKGPLGKLRLA